MIDAEPHSVDDLSPVAQLVFGATGMMASEALQQLKRLSGNTLTTTDIIDAMASMTLQAICAAAANHEWAGRVLATFGSLYSEQPGAMAQFLDPAKAEAFIARSAAQAEEEISAFLNSVASRQN